MLGQLSEAVGTPSPSLSRTEVTSASSNAVLSNSSPDGSGISGKIVAFSIRMSVKVPDAVQVMVRLLTSAEVPSGPNGTVEAIVVVFSVFIVTGFNQVSTSVMVSPPVATNVTSQVSTSFVVIW
jgi:hypothetical protein